MTLREQGDFWQARYGEATPNGFSLDDPVLQRLWSHRSVRAFLEEPLPEGTLELLVGSAQSAATSSNLQTWSVVALQDPSHKSEASVLCGDQAFIRQAPLFLVFCADLSRLKFVSELQGLAGEGLDYFEMFLMATIDATLAAQNVAIAAEALGLGICYVGAARNRPTELAELLHLPEWTVALFGMAIGIPDPTKPTSIKPRLPQNEVLFHETYSSGDREENIERYNEAMAAFYDSQGMNVQGTWARHSAKRVENREALNGRDVLRQVVEERGFPLK